MITADTPVDEILERHDVIAYFLERGVSPVTCSGAFTQSLGRLLAIKKVADPQAFIDGLNAALEKAEQTSGAREDA